MQGFHKPIVVISKCLGFDPCRYNGDVIHDKFIEKLANFVTYITVCPEVEIGLGIPREPIRLVSNKSDKKIKLVQPKTESDLTVRMKNFADRFLDSLHDVDGFILKSRSPSCAISDAKVTSGMEKTHTISKNAGLFGDAVLKRYSHLAVEDEGRIKNFAIREHFLIKLFTLAHFNNIKRKNNFKDLLIFHSNNKYLFMAYNQVKLKELGRITANGKKMPVEEMYMRYEEVLADVLQERPSYTSNINVLHHIMGYFSKVLTKGEKEFFLNLVEQYRMNMVPLSSPVGVLKSWNARHKNMYLAEQTFFTPYPTQLIEITDSGKGRNFA
ncbi:DUF523 and DUF1722 domain-containing protein [Evansella sp. AB-P1]|uniref:YbgA family protein n=1 Tax=Evansella sp. AB-P1 TaxID=3037653 RepID=UPI00241C19D2|nr:DUF523 and DUF1722 domain-containing protein [Evansella sp. AB-P1]MDG5789527.1 DUF523 and DUF1722 domain-containing protein [Evansella sp. AB-P1]